MKSRTPFYALVAGLFIAGVVLIAIQRYGYDVPLLPGEHREIWEVEAQVHFEATGDPVLVSLAVPDQPAGYRRLSEHTVSPGYGASVVEPATGRRVEWSIRRAAGPQTLYYKARLLHGDTESTLPVPAAPAAPGMLVRDEAFRASAEQLLGEAYARSASPFSLARELARRLTQPPLGDHAHLLLSQAGHAEVLVDLLARAGVHATVVRGIYLRDGRRQQKLEAFVQVYDGDRAQFFNPRTGREGRPADLLLWEVHGAPVLDVVGGANSTLLFSMIKQYQPALEVSHTLQKADALLNFSIHSLPVEERAMFQNLLLIPVGALMVVLLRVFVGIRTAGTFMPVLIALAFMQTSLLAGVPLFILLISVGLWLRSYVSRLNLLLVSRVSAVIIAVVGLIGLFSVVSFHLGLNAGLKLMFFPMVIISWTIERMSILWEEEGPREVIVQTGGSLLTAVIAFLVMNNAIVKHVAFNFIGLQLVILSVVVAAGSYTGYRLLELRRFAGMREQLDVH
ncbi:MAG: inactive transglutaminase family protein [Gammaproteobacteria bacterium]|nr:inactive transglutaminase family protein [Gammaproteobacteria bacterium]